jgi:hypothetical protein
VVRVVDGDTIEVQLSDGRREKVRYIGINTPEIHHPTKGAQPGGAEAREMNRRLVEGKTVDLEFDVQQRDKYGRLLAYVRTMDGTHVNTELAFRGVRGSGHLPAERPVCRVLPCTRAVGTGSEAWTMGRSDGHAGVYHAGWHRRSPGTHECSIPG